MKKILMITGFIILALYARPQDGSQNLTKDINLYPNEIRVGFFQFFLNTFYLEYEHFFPNNTGLVVEGGMSLRKNSYEEIFGGQGGLQFRLYTNNLNRDLVALRFDRAYFGPYFKLKYLDVTDLDGADINNITIPGIIQNTYTTFAGGIVVGIKLSMLERITLDFNIGGGIQFTDESEDQVPDYAYDVFGVAYTGVTPVANFTFGFKF
ncbi:MAG: hypothetical protein JXB00_17050 [Bacteroidales bacterium]|nr:hypothetical protein [Bacteroidales bacterium]